MDAADAGIPVRMAVPDTDGTMTRRQWVAIGAGCLLVILAPGLFVAAFIQGQTAYLGRIALGIVPLAAPFVWLHASVWRWKRRTGTARPCAGDGDAAPTSWWLAKDGVHMSKGRPCPWDGFAGYRIDAGPPEPRIRLIYARGQRLRRVPWGLLAVASGLWIGASFEAATAAEIVRQRGWGADATLAACISVMYVLPLALLGGTVVRERWPGRPPPEAFTTTLSVDPADLEPVLDLLGRHLPRLGEDTTDGSISQS